MFFSDEITMRIPLNAFLKLCILRFILCFYTAEVGTVARVDFNGFTFYDE